MSAFAFNSRPIFADWSSVCHFISQTHESWAHKIVRFYVQTEELPAEPVTHYLIMTGIAGFVNHFSGLGRQRNCQIVAHPERGLGDALLALQLGHDSSSL
jgi:hypothetical protein